MNKLKALLSQNLNPLNHFNMNQLIKYEKQAVIETFDGERYYIPETSYGDLKNALKSDKFVEVNGELINSSSVKRVFIEKQNPDLTREQKAQLKERMAGFKRNLGRWPREAEVEKMTKKLFSK